MKKTNLCGNEVSRLGFGCMRFPTINGKVNEKLAFEMLDSAYFAGINYYDTAYVYIDGQSEKILGNYINQKRIRGLVYIADKLPVFDLKKKSDMQKYLDESLKRLGTNYIDYYLMHSLDKKRWEFLKSLDYKEFIEKNIANGKIRHIGFSFHDDFEVFKEIIDDYNWEFCQIQFNYVDQNIQAGIKGYNYATEKGIPIIVMEPLRGGRLTKVPSIIRDVFDGRFKDVSDVEIALRYVANFENNKLILSGMRSVDDVVFNSEFFNHIEPNTLNRFELEDYNTACKFFEKFLSIPCTACDYCKESCPVFIPISSIFTRYNKQLDEPYLDDDENKDWYQTVAHKADTCIKCGACERHCPQKIEIREKLSVCHKHFIK